MATNKDLRRTKIRKGIRGKIAGTSSKPRLSVFRSNDNMYAQIIDDSKGHTLLSYSTKLIVNSTGSKIELSKEAGKQLAEKAVANGITSIVFDRSGYLYHGRVKALAEGAREGGLKF
ncbi:MAG: 50S ribosomal protein L18 [Cytophagales bacterium]|nr:MAG: 50S ribosomal protein L18 [Cytophagales bacterium]